MGKYYIDIEKEEAEAEDAGWELVEVLLLVFFIIAVILGCTWFRANYSRPREINTYQDAQTLDEKLDFIYQTLEHMQTERDE